LRRNLEALATGKSEIAKTSPHIGGLAYQLGKASVLRGEHKHRVDTEGKKSDTPS